MAEVARLKAEIPALEAEEKQVSTELDDALAQIPNLPLDEVPDGTDESANVEHHHFGAKRNYGFAPQQHFDLGEALGQMDFETAAKLSGARFVVLKSGVARLERALGQFMLDLHTGEHGYTEVNPPLLVRDDTMFGTAQLPKFAEDQFAVIRLADEQQQLEQLGAEYEGSRESKPGSFELEEKLTTFEFPEFGKIVSGSFPPPKSRSPIWFANPSSTKPCCPCGSPPARRAFAPRRGRRARTPAA